MKKIITILAIMFVFGLANVVLADNPTTGNTLVAKGKFASLTADQKAQIKAIHKNARQQIKAILTADQLKKLKDVKGQGKEAHKAAWKALKATLTDDQKAKIKEIRKDSRKQIKTIIKGTK